ncbi:MAG: UPF0182 family protein [Gemmatimonadota bacterium]|nr:UPF0182 family protein [Gemmatimonadota bacterium]
MSPRAVRITVAVLSIVVLLFAGRWAAGLAADQWWAERLSPAAARFVTDWAIMRLAVEALGVITACSWFIGHLLIVHRAIGSVQLHRRLGNLEIREAVNMELLVALSIGGGMLLGLFAGRGVGAWTPDLVLAWSGLAVGEVDPLLSRDLGFYLARLPAWRLLHGHLILLISLAFIGAATLYLVIGALRWSDRRLAINDHARRHLGGLLVVFALVLAWGYLLEPLELVGGVIGSVHGGLFPFREGVSSALTGIALTAALLSLWWAVNGRHTLLLSIWIVLGAASLLGHHVIPALIGGDRVSPLDPAMRRHLDQLAYGITGLKDSILLPSGQPPTPPDPLGLWQPTLTVEATRSDSGQVVSADRALVPMGRSLRPAWLVIRDRGKRGAGITVVLDDRATLAGEPLIYAEAESLHSTAGVPVLNLSPHAVWPGGRPAVMDSAQGGVQIGSGLRRLALAWTLQSGDLLGTGTGGKQLFWHLDPVDRLQQLAPFAVWGVPAPRMVGGELVWVVDGYLASSLFAGSTRVGWRDRWIGGLRAGFVGVIHAETGVTSVYLRHTADQVAETWRELFPGMVQPASAIPAEILRALPYPVELLEVQLRVMSHPHWNLGRLSDRAEEVKASGPAVDALWKSDTTGLTQVVPFERADGRMISAILEAHMADGREAVTVYRVDSLLALPDPSTLQTRWGRIPTFQQLKDSVEKTGARLEAGPVQFWPTNTGLGAYQIHFARHDAAPPAVAWISLALGDRRGAGHDLEEAWQNYLGLSAPIISATERGTVLFEIRRHLVAADAALRRGDLEMFGRQWEAIKRLVGTP